MEEKPSKKNKYQCTNCKSFFSTSSNLSKHKKKCEQYAKKQKDLENTIEKLKLENENKILYEKLHSLQKENQLIKEENEYHKQLIISAGNVIQSSMSTLNHLILNYSNAPILEPLKDYSALEEKSKFINNLVYYHNENKLDQYIGNFLVKHYKTNDPKERSNWNSDTSRLTYINRELVNNKPNWVIDKKGVKMTNIIIDPILEYIKKLSQNEITILKDNLENEMNEPAKNKIIKKMTSFGEIIKNINNKVLSKEINRYLAPHLYFDKNNVLILKK